MFPYEYQRALKSIGNGVQHKETKEEEEKSVVDIENIVVESKRPKLDKTRGFIKYKREKQPYRDAKNRLKDWDEIHDFGRVRRELQTQAARCMDCGIPFCHSDTRGCPLGNVIPKFNDLVFKNKWESALETLLQTNNFPEFTGRVCPAPCEGACVLGISEPPVTIKNVECAIADVGFEKGWIKPVVNVARSGKRVAVVGSGPAGLAAADQLNKTGHDVVVIERADRIGGLLRYGIPSMKLSKAVVQRRVDLMAQEGVEFRTGVEIGVDVAFTELKRDFDASVLCLGAAKPRDLPIPGRNSQGIHFAMDYLRGWQRRQEDKREDEEDAMNAKDLDVVVIGGGDTGCDCIGTALRQGAKSVVSFEILPQPPDQRAEDNPWPQFPKVFKVDYGHEEVKVKWDSDDPRRYNTMSKEFLVDNSTGRVTGIKTVQVVWTREAKTSPWTMKAVAGSEKIYACQMALLAMGFVGPEDKIDVKRNARGNVDAAESDYKVGEEGVFAAGDCRRGQSLVVWAIAEGRQAAKAVDEFLTGKTSALPGPAGVIRP